MSWSFRFHPFSWFRRRLSDFVVGQLTRPLKSYHLDFPNDLANLKRHIRKGDVVLVEGNERISECIKYLTQSSWSHSALYIGDEAQRRNPELKEALRAKFGEEADHLLVEALVESGVVLSPLSKYRDFNIRVCHPYNLASRDLDEVLDEALRSVGSTYDVKNIVDLLRYFLPFSFVPARFRRKALRFGSGEPTRVICSSLVASCFQRVKFPINPEIGPLPEKPEKPRRLRLIWPLRSRAERWPFGVLRPVSPTLVTPRDFDLSPYFEVIKFNVIENLRFDYRNLPWASDVDVAGKRA